VIVRFDTDHNDATGLLRHILHTFSGRERSNRLFDCYGEIISKHCYYCLYGSPLAAGLGARIAATNVNLKPSRYRGSGEPHCHAGPACPAPNAVPRKVEEPTSAETWWWWWWLWDRRQTINKPQDPVGEEEGPTRRLTESRLFLERVRAGIRVLVVHRRPRIRSSPVPLRPLNNAER